MEPIISKLMQSIDRCLLPKLERNFEEMEEHPQYANRTEIIAAEYPTVHNLLGELDLEHEPAVVDVFSSLLILYEELQSETRWTDGVPEEYPKRLNDLLELACGVTFQDMLTVRRDFYDPQEVFDLCMEKIHRRLTPEHFKMYPATINVYLAIARRTREGSITVNPARMLPASLLLIDDFVPIHRQKGLMSCMCILKSMPSNGFHTGNYYEVVYSSLKNSLTDQDIQINKMAHNCLMELIRLLPAQIKTVKSGDLFMTTLEQIQQDSNIYRKSNNFRFSKKMIEIHGVNCTNRKKIFNQIICDNLEMCAITGIAVVMIASIMECFEEWIKHCWCVWDLKLADDQQVLSVILKVMYANIDFPNLTCKLQEVLETLIAISSKEDQQRILRSLKEKRVLTNEEFLKILEDTENEARARLEKK